MVRPRIQLLMAESEYRLVSGGPMPSSSRRTASRDPLPATRRASSTWWVPGEKRPRRAMGKTQQEAVERRAKRREQAGLDLGGLRTVGRLADWWLHNVYRHAVRRSSWAKAEDR